MQKKILYLLAACLLFSLKAHCSFDFNERIQKAYQQIIRLKFDDGKRLLDEEQRLNPSNQLPLLYNNYIDFLKAFISEERKDFDLFSSNASERLDKLKEENSPFSLYSRAEMMLQEAMLRIKFREFVPAAWEIRKVYKIIEKNSSRFPSFPLNKKNFSFLHIIVGAVPENYRGLVKLVGMEGTIVQGTDELNAMLGSIDNTGYKVYREEILFYLSSVKNSFSKNENSTLAVSELMKPLCRQSLLMRYCYSNLMMKIGKNEEALQALSDTSSQAGTYPFYFLNYKTGLARLRKLDYSAAERELQKFITHFHGINYLRSACQNVAWIYLLKGDQKKYSDYINLCRRIGNDFVDEDKDATNEATEKEIPNLLLLRARLLFDGGYYQQSLAIIAGKSAENFPRFKDQLEVSYRFARILHKLNQVDKAIAYFEQTLKNGSETKYYFAANSALLLGTIYEERNDFEKAKIYYTKCLSLRNHEYQNSIDQKAHAGLERVDKN